MRVLSRFLMAATDPSQFPAPALPEVCFLGRSNVGKSSVINALVGKKLAKTSSIPGRTRSINFFELRWPGKPQPELMFTDLPGYGYAQLSREISSHWPDFIEPYLKERPCLALCLILVDVNVPPQESDTRLLRFLGSIGRPFSILGTKSDRLSGNQLRNALHTLTREFPQAKVLPFSAKTGAGRDELWREIREAANNYRIQFELAHLKAVQSTSVSS
jgi:GTP-binding protein